MPVWKLIIEYDGTRYYGWQEQPRMRTVAGELRAAAEKVIGSRVDLSGSGRTDAGVHAIGQVARLSANRRISPVELQRAINAELPTDINVLNATTIDPKFDPRRDALARYYLYQISTRRTAFAKKFVWWVRDKLNENSMEEASKRLTGRHDFANLSERRDDNISTVVLVERAQIARAGDLILFRIGASHFLWKMVRRIVGVLVEIGRGNLDARVVDLLLSSRGKSERLPDVASVTAPPSGLFLEKVIYQGDRRPGRIEALFPVPPAQRE
jgi:tRNA pseudouridine38-40 synthase